MARMIWVCLRYLDDFIILGPNLRDAKRAFNKALGILKSINLDAYDAKLEPKKASFGPIKDGFEFLGIDIIGNTIKPCGKSINRLLLNIDDIFNESLRVDFSKIEDNSKEEYSLNNTLQLAHNKFKGWGNQYYFCNDNKLWNLLDQEMDLKIKKYFDGYYAKLRSLNMQQRRRLLGVHLLIDSKIKPIIWD